MSVRARLVMLGTALETRGGIAAVLGAYRAHGLFERWPVEYVATHRDGGALRKLLAALGALLRLAALLARRRGVILHVHCASRASFWRKSIFMALGLCAGCPLILHLHGGGFARFYEAECGAARRRVVRFFLDHAACVIVVSERWRAWVAGVTRNGRVVCVPNPAPAPEAPAGPRRGDTVLFVGRVARGKGVFDLLEAIGALRASIPGIRLVCAGDGDLAAAALRAARLGIGDAVTLTGWIGPAERQAWMRRAAVFVLPSYAEGLPMSLLEAMAAGVPVVAARVGGVADAITEGVDGFTFPAGDTPELTRLLHRLLLNPDLGERLALAARETVRRRFAPGRVIAQLEGIYASLGLARRAQARADLPPVLVLGPHRAAVSGVSTHLNVLFGSRLAEDFALLHFQVGSEGRSESVLGRLARLALSPVALALEIVARRAAIVHLNTSLNRGAYWRDLVYLMVAKCCGARVLYQVHGGALPQQFLRGHVLGAFLRWTLRLPDAIAVLAQAELEAYRSAVPAQRVLTLANAIDCAPYARVSRARADPAQPLQLAYVGRLIRAKGLFETVQALSIAKARGTRVSLSVAGSGPDERALRDYAQALGVASAVRFTGPVHGDAKLRLLAQSDAFVLASYSEGLPYALLEALAAGLPVIATRVGAIPDVVADGVHGLLVPGRDPEALYRAMAALSGDRDRLARMSAACRARVSAAYSMERLAGELRRIYTDLCAAKLVSQRPPCAE